MAVNVFALGLNLPVPPLQVPPVATVTEPARLAESFLQMDTFGPALTVGLGVMVTVTLEVTGVHPALTAVKVKATVVGAAPSSAAEGV